MPTSNRKVSVYLNDNEYKRLRAIAQANGLGMASLLRLSALQWAAQQPEPVEPEPEPVEGSVLSTAELAALLGVTTAGILAAAERNEVRSGRAIYSHRKTGQRWERFVPPGQAKGYYWRLLP